MFPEQVQVKRPSHQAQEVRPFARDIVWHGGPLDAGPLGAV